MGERDIIRTVRRAGAASLLLGAAVVLTGCSALGMGPASAATASGPVIDPSVPSATPTEPVASAPTPTLSPVETLDPTSPTDSRVAVVPVITTHDWDASAQVLDLGAIVPNIVEDGGTCTYTVTAGSTTRTATSTGVAASSYTGCPAAEVAGLSAGTWQVRVSYSSDKASGASGVQTAKVG